jgi:dipeptidyl aminopeptidase/acylaminoacyl peptidase
MKNADSTVIAKRREGEALSLAVAAYLNRQAWLYFESREIPMIVRIGVTFSLLFLIAPAYSAEKPSKKDKWSVDDVLLAETATGFEISPDGRWAVWVKTAMDRDKGERVSNLMRTDLSKHEDIELTRGEESSTGPRWSPDGKLIAFMSERPAPKKEKRRDRADDKDGPKSQIWLINPFGGESWRLTDEKRGIIQFHWAGPDRIVFIAQEDKSLYESTTNDEKKDSSNIVDDEKHEPPARLFRADVKSKKVTRLTENTDRIDWVAVSPDGKHAVAHHQRSLHYEYDSRIKPVVYLHDLDAGTFKPIFADAKFNVSSARWAPDGKGFYAVNDFNSKPEFAYPAISQLYWFDITSGSAKLIDLGWENGLASQDANSNDPGFVPTKDGFIALLANGARNKVAHYARTDDGWKREWLTGDHVANIFGFAAARDGKLLVYAHSTASTPTQWYQTPLDAQKLGKAEVIGSMADELKKLPIAKTEVIRWKGALDEQVEGILYYPHGFEPGKKHPLIVMIHGGPASLDTDSWDESWGYAANLYCQRGAFVLKPNYHGSSNYGLKWVESIAGGKYYDLEVPDIEKGVDHLIDKGLVDKDKLGVMGWSNGAILTIALTVSTTRYKCAVAGAGDVDWPSDWANCDFGDAFDRAYLGKGPFDDPELYIKKSPFYKLDKVRTPTLILFGTEDRSVATQQGWMHYRGLQQLGKTDVRFVLFPGEKHGLKKYVYQKRKLEEELAWFDKHLFKTAKDENEAIKDDSPLDRALKRQGAKRDKNLFGLRFNDQLIPETVAHAGLQVGRFEVTRAQFRAFREKFIVEPGTENYPATGISFDDANEYCAWLSKLTGAKYRLPTEEEGDDLYGDKDGENTLDHWAGYTINPDDTKRLREKIAALGGKSLLKEVGNFKATGEAGVFDLGGNAAEWVVTKDGKGKLMGGSADQPADGKRKESRAAAEYRGFRVIREDKKK